MDTKHSPKVLLSLLPCCAIVLGLPSRWTEIVVKSSAETTSTEPEVVAGGTQNEWLYRIGRNGRCGYINNRGKVVFNMTPGNCDTTITPQGVRVALEGKWGYLGIGGNLLIPIRFDDISDFVEGLADVRVGNRWGYVNSKGEIVVEPSFEDRRAFSEGFAAVKVGTSWLYVNMKGERVTEAVWEDAGDFSEGLAPVRQGGLWGYINERGHLRIEPKYDYAGEFHDGLAAAKLDGLWGIITPAGKWAIYPKLSSLLEFGHGLAPAQLGELWGYVDRSGRWALEPHLKVGPHPLPWFDVYADRMECAVFNREARKLVYLRSQSCGHFWPNIGEGYFPMEVDSKWGFIDPSGKVAVEPKYEQVDRFSEGLAAVRVRGEWGYVDGEGRVIVEPTYSYVGEFKEGLARVCLAESCGYINHSGEVKVELKFATASGFDHGLARVNLGRGNGPEEGPYAYVDNTGRCVWCSPQGPCPGWCVNPPSRLRRTALIAVGGQHTCMAESEGKIWCWGRNQLGELGVPPAETTSGCQELEMPAACSSVPVAVPGIRDVHAMAIGSGNSFEGHTCAVLSTGKLLCWGSNSYGQLGIGSTKATAGPAAVRSLKDVAKVSASHDHTCAVQRTGGISCWGSNVFGQLGIGSRRAPSTCKQHDLDVGCSYSPMVVDGIPPAIEVSAGGGFTCALTSQGEVWCWGGGWAGRLGNGMSEDSRVPVRVCANPDCGSALRGVIALDSGGASSCALVREGRVLCWGWDGLDASSIREAPATFLEEAIGIGVGDFYSCAVTPDHAVLCWGDGHPLPEVVLGLPEVTALAVGGKNACATTKSGLLKCWGEDSYGQTGAGTVGGAGTRRILPVTTVGTWR